MCRDDSDRAELDQFAYDRGSTDPSIMGVLPLRSSSNKKSAATPVFASSTICFIRTISAKSGIGCRVPSQLFGWKRRSCKREICMARAETGAPAHASAVFNPMARRKVLFPDMFDPETISNWIPCRNETSLPIDLLSGSRGCSERFFAWKLGTASGMSSGKHQCGRSKLREARDESFEFRQCANQEATCIPD